MSDERSFILYKTNKSDNSWLSTYIKITLIPIVCYLKIPKQMSFSTALSAIDWYNELQELQIIAN